VHSFLIPYWTLFLQFLLLLGGSCAIDGYDEAPSCSSFASGSFDIDVIFHVHCTKPVWCVTAVVVVEKVRYGLMAVGIEPRRSASATAK